MTSTIFKSYPLENDPEMAALILAGLPTTVLRKVAAFLGLRPAKIGSLVNINEKTLERRLKAHARLKPDESCLTMKISLLGKVVVCVWLFYFLI